MSEFIPDLVEINGQLFHSYVDGRLEPAKNDDCEIFKPFEFYKLTSLDTEYLASAWNDNLNPFVEKKCKSCGSSLMRHVIMREKNIYVCECGKYLVGESISK